jgi:hypothetical protein
MVRHKGRSPWGARGGLAEGPLRVALCGAIAAAGCWSGSTDPQPALYTPVGNTTVANDPTDANIPTEADADAQAFACTVAPGEPGNELGVGRYCVPGQHDCPAGLLCSADYLQIPNGICYKLCAQGAADCGSNAHCVPTPQPAYKVCYPSSCL